MSSSFCINMHAYAMQSLTESYSLTVDIEH